MLAKSAPKPLSKGSSKPKKLLAEATSKSSGNRLQVKIRHGIDQPREKSSEVVAVAPDTEEKPHKSSLKKAKRKVERLREKAATDLTVISEALERVPTMASQEKRHLDEYMNMFENLSLLIRKAERVCLAEEVNSKEYYALSALMSQQREIIADIRSVTDMSGQVATMDTTVVRPLVSSIGQNVLDCMFQIRKIIIDCSDKDKTQAALHALEAITKEQGKFLQAQYATASDKVTSILLG